jgi:coproporphyrinogen III oxidase-like Fe-S oxidoreductase
MDCPNCQVSNYARPGHRSRHNQVYWKGMPYYAFGLGAASYLAGRRFSRPARMREYVAWVEELAAAGGEVLPGGHLPPESPVRWS